MERTLADVAAGGAPLGDRLRVALELALAVEALHRRGGVHGALSPGAVRVAEDGTTVALAPPGERDPLARAGFAAPEEIRGGGPSRHGDAFAAAALAQLVLTGRGPFDGGEADALEIARRVLFEAPRPVRLDAPGMPAEVDEAIAGLLARRARRRGGIAELVRAIEAVVRGEGLEGPSTSTPTKAAAPEPTSTATANPTSTSTSTSTATATSTSTSSKTKSKTRSKSKSKSKDLLLRAVRSACATARRMPASPLHRAVIAAVPLLVAAALLLPGSDAGLAREVGRAIARGDLAAARAALDAAPRGADRALVEKLRGDLACARRAPGECLRRYRTALAARPSLRADEALRRNVRALLARDGDCATRRSAALLVGELRDPEALPALRAARRSAGPFAFLCTGDALDRAIAATRAAAR